jgi:plastocyanin
MPVIARHCVALALVAFVSACSAREATDWSVAEQVTLTMTEYRFSPAQLSFRRGAAYRLRLVNQGAELHEFTAPAFLAAIDLRDAAVLAPGHSEVVIVARSEKELDFVARRPGHYDLTCADHDWAGMVGGIVIE